MDKKPYKRLMIGDQFKYNGQIWQKTAPKKKGCCGSPLLYNAHQMGNQKTHKIFQPDDQLEMIEKQEKENMTTKPKNKGRSEKVRFREIAEDSFFSFQNSENIFKKNKNGGISETGKFVRVPGLTLVNFFPDFVGEQPEAPEPPEAPKQKETTEEPNTEETEVNEAN